MKVSLKKISGAFNEGYALDKHSILSDFIGYNRHGFRRYKTTRTPAGEAMYQLKYQNDFDQVAPLAKAVFCNILPKFPEIGLVVPAPASRTRPRQPVHEVAADIARRIGVPLSDNLIRTSPDAPNIGSLKDMNTREEKDDALDGRYFLNKAIEKKGSWNALVMDDLYDSGATMDAVCSLLAEYDKISGVYVAALTRK